MSNLKAVLRALRLPVLLGGGVEADDALAALTQAATARGWVALRTGGVLG
jgi:hypothetical protein